MIVFVGIFGKSNGQHANTSVNIAVYFGILQERKK